jgi:hypothetical protein
LNLFNKEVFEGFDLGVWIVKKSNESIIYGSTAKRSFSKTYSENQAISQLRADRVFATGKIL